MHEVGTWERYVLKTSNIVTYRTLTYSVITIGRSYIFKNTVSTIR